MIIRKVGAKKEFKPITLAITIDNEDELLDLLGRSNIANSEVQRCLKFICGVTKELDTTNISNLYLYRTLLDLAREAGLIEEDYLDEE